MEFDPEKFDVISVADAIAHPQFDPHVRDIVLAANERAGDLKLAELAEIVGVDAATLARRIIGEVVLSEVRRIGEAEAAKRKGLN